MKGNMVIVEDLREHIKMSPFNRSSYKVDTQLSDLYGGLAFYLERNLDSEGETKDNIISLMTPRFQRDNDKWNLQRKISFVENVMSGYRSTVMLYSLGICVHKFKSEKEAVQFYIDINKGLSHSEDDIKRAEYYLKGL